MSLPTVKVVDIQHNNTEVFLENLTQTCLGSLIWECEQLLDKLKDAEAIIEDQCGKNAETKNFYSMRRIEMSTVRANTTALSAFMRSMEYAILKAKNGSDAEDMYFIEKLEKIANRLGYDLIKRD